MTPAERVPAKFTNPPVSEVAVSVFFKSLPGFLTAHYGQFWQTLQKEYPKTQDQPPLIEAGTIEIVENLPPPLRRVFLISADDNLVTQIQPDFFAHNWRRVRDTDRYPSFDLPRDLFLRQWAAFQDFVKRIDAGEVKPTRYEITYVNQIIEPPGSFPLAIERYSPLVSLHPSQNSLRLRALLAELQFDLPEKLGILRVSFKQGERKADKVEVMQVELTARLFRADDSPSLNEWLERAHECIATSFVELTTKEAHKKWGRTQ